MIKFYLIPPQRQIILTKWYHQLLQYLQTHPYRTSNPDKAEYFIPGFDTALETNWPEYNGKSNNFVVGKYEEIGNAAAESLDYLSSYIDNFPNKKYLIISLHPGNFKLISQFYHLNNVIFAHNNFSENVYRKNVDISFPASAVVQLERQETDFAVSCKHLLSFQGIESHPVRKELHKLHDGKKVIINLLKKNEKHNQEKYINLLKESSFSLVPRGDCRFSYRLAEAMAAGSIPVIFSDGWQLPFSEIINYDTFAIRIPENLYDHTLPLLENFQPEHIAIMRKNSWQMYKNHFASIRMQMATLFIILKQRQNITITTKHVWNDNLISF